ncbi:hypothetical protein LAT59_00730 [Candidatus Gracilibacteria bacterium]|nr:hypothetical protein [Candidatus Gracilibacteria bacterium]
MKLFAGTIFFTNPLLDVLPELDIDILKISEKGLYVMGGLEDEQTLDDVMMQLEKTFSIREYTDISFEDEDTLEILTEELESGVYESVSFEGPELQFEDILERFTETDTVLCVREVEVSKRYKNRVIRVDFLY